MAGPHLAGLSRGGAQRGGAAPATGPPTSLLPPFTALRCASNSWRLGRPCACRGGARRPLILKEPWRQGVNTGRRRPGPAVPRVPGRRGGPAAGAAGRRGPAGTRRRLAVLGCAGPRGFTCGTFLAGRGGAGQGDGGTGPRRPAAAPSGWAPAWPGGAAPVLAKALAAAGCVAASPPRASGLLLLAHTAGGRGPRQRCRHSRARGRSGAPGQAPGAGELNQCHWPGTRRCARLRRQLPLGCQPQNTTNFL
ncbi:hypothetical protein E2C01_076381 [Portunus trituberculatus]|uniref:Uncharacterized protein n=1 Tax=Portunus trituberculatus TaxID=210409 RepID=A0A5B7ILW2_PORTR|nr:hypothetical protein [Portunus trituberculatus]